jgi:hypothetical protein
MRERFNILRMVSYLESKNTLHVIAVFIANHARPAAPSHHRVDHQDGEEENDTAPEEAVDQEAWAWEEGALQMTEERQGSSPGQVGGRAYPA